MLDRHALAVTLFGFATAAVTTLAAVPTVIAQAANGSTELGPVITGGGALSLTAVLGFIAIKLARGELVPRDVKAVEAALTKLAENGDDREAALADLVAERGDLLREVVTELAASRAARGGAS